MRNIIVVLLIIGLFSCPISSAPLEVDLSAQEACDIVEIIFKSNFYGGIASERNDIHYENYEFRSVTYRENTGEWLVRYDLTDEGFYNVFGVEKEGSGIWDDRWSPVIFSINKNNCEILAVQSGIRLAFTLSDFFSQNPINLLTAKYRLLTNEADAILISNIIFRSIFANDTYKSVAIKENEQNYEWQISYFFDDGSIFKIHMAKGSLKINNLEFIDR